MLDFPPFWQGRYFFDILFGFIYTKSRNGSTLERTNLEANSSPSEWIIFRRETKQFWLVFLEGWPIPLKARMLLGCLNAFELGFLKELVLVLVSSKLTLHFGPGPVRSTPSERKSRDRRGQSRDRTPKIHIQIVRNHCHYLQALFTIEEKI